MPPLNILVVGASIAGPTTAYWLTKTGAKITIIERSPQFRTTGQGVDIRTVGVTVMRKMAGMEAAVRAKTTTEAGLSLVRDDGRPYGVIRPTGNPDRQALISEYEIFRGDLAKVLYDLTKEHRNIQYIFNEQVTSMQRRDDDHGPITVDFKNGLPSSEYDLVVACDGAYSKTRAIGLAIGIRDHVVPINCWAAYFSLPQDLLQGSKVGLAHSGVGGQFVSIGPDPSGVTRATLFSIYPKAIQPFRDAMKQGEIELKQYIANHFKGVGWRTKEILNGMMESTDFYANEIVQVKLPHLSAVKGGFTCVGDAGYATGPTGGGTSIAMAGGYLLAGEINRHKGDLRAGLKGYEEKMKPIILDLQKIPPFVPGVMSPQTVWGIWLRNWIFASIAWSGVLEVVGKYFGSAFAENGNKYGLPEYEWEE